jgi:hypothetical protein
LIETGVDNGTQSAWGAAVRVKSGTGRKDAGIALLRVADRAGFGDVLAGEADISGGGFRELHLRLKISSLRLWNDGGIDSHRCAAIQDSAPLAQSRAKWSRDMVERLRPLRFKSRKACGLMVRQ